MKSTPLLLLVLCAAACRPEKHRQADNTTPPRTVSRSATRPVVAPLPPPPLLKTPRITIFSTGNGLTHTTIQSADQAEAILADIQSMPPSAGRDNAMSSVIGSLAKADPTRARSHLEAWDHALIGHWLGAAKSVAENLAKSDPEVAAKFIEDSVPSASRMEIWGHFLVNLPPTARLPFFDRIPEGTEKIRIAADLVTVWLPEDPQACAAWLDQFTAGRSQEEIEYLGQPLRAAMAPKSGPQPWLAAYHAAESSEARRFLANAVWQRADPAERSGLIPVLQDTLTDLPERELTAAIAADPAAYANALSPAQVAALPSEEVRKIVNHWSENHPEQAIDWAMKHGSPVAADALSNLYQLEPKAVAGLASKLPRGKELDRALATVCTMMASDGEADIARSLVPLITNPAQREGTREEIEKRARERSGNQ